MHVNRQISCEPVNLRSTDPQVELTVRDAGEKVAARSATSGAVRHFDDSCGGPITPPVWVLLITRHKPGSIPSANAVELPKAHAVTKPHALCETHRQSCTLVRRLTIISRPAVVFARERPRLSTVITRLRARV